VQAELKRRGHVIKTQKMLGVASMRAVVIDAASGTLSAAAAPGSDGYALGK
jgi:gamma-glutamyltranspeptidase